MLVLRAQDVAALDAAAERAGLPPTLLMGRAGRGVASFVVRTLPAARRLAVLVGPGNNGGDGYVAAAAKSRAPHARHWRRCQTARAPACRSAAPRRTARRSAASTR